MGSNATEGHIWQEFSSKTYKELPAVHVSDLVDPLHTSLKLIPFDASGGRGYYRTPTLANVWATAPFLHNNSVGLFNGDPSVAGRVAAYQNAMELMLWPERRPGVKTIRRCSCSVARSASSSRSSAAARPSWYLGWRTDVSGTAASAANSMSS